MSSHFDFYSSLGLDPSGAPEELANNLNRRLTELHQQGVPITSGEVQVCLTALAILSNPEKRKLYDERLSDDSAPLITPQALRQLADTGSFEPTGATADAAPTAVVPAVSATPAPSAAPTASAASASATAPASAAAPASATAGEAENATASTEKQDASLPEIQPEPSPTYQTQLQNPSAASQSSFAAPGAATGGAPRNDQAPHSNTGAIAPRMTMAKEKVAPLPENATLVQAVKRMPMQPRIFFFLQCGLAAIAVLSFLASMAAAFTASFEDYLGYILVSTLLENGIFYIGLSALGLYWAWGALLSNRRFYLIPFFVTQIPLAVTTVSIAVVRLDAGAFLSALGYLAWFAVVIAGIVFSVLEPVQAWFKGEVLVPQPSQPSAFAPQAPQASPAPQVDSFKPQNQQFGAEQAKPAQQDSTDKPGASEGQ